MSSTKKSSVTLIFILSAITIVALIALPAMGTVPVENAPDLVRFFGRFHPVILHMPIGIIFLIASMEIFSWLPKVKKFNTTFPMLLGALTSIVAVVLGFLLYQGGGYTGEVAERHLWGGTIVACLAVAAFALKFFVDSREGKGNGFYQFLVLLTCGVMMFASHDGATMTHGSEYLTQYMPDPLRKMAGMETKAEKEAKKAELAAVPVAERNVYESTIVPILEAKCYSCHAEEKQKGKLRMDSMAALLKGGSEGPSIVAGDPEESTMLTRIHLPIDDDEHMPPEGKPQIEDHELEILTWWVKKGASDTATFGELEAGDEIEAHLAKLVSPAELKAMEEAKAAAEEKAQAEAEAKRKALEISMAAVKKDFPGALNFVSKQSTKLTFSAVSMRAKFTNEHLEKLLPVAGGITSLDLTATGLTDEAAETLIKFKNLENLKLGETKISDASMLKISELDKLKSLNLFATEVTDAGVEKLKNHPLLENVYLWGSKVTVAGIESLKQAKPELNASIGLDN